MEKKHNKNQPHCKLKEKKRREMSSVSSQSEMETSKPEDERLSDNLSISEKQQKKKEMLETHRTKLKQNVKRSLYWLMRTCFSIEMNSK